MNQTTEIICTVILIHLGISFSLCYQSHLVIQKKNQNHFSPIRVVKNQVIFKDAKFWSTLPTPNGPKSQLLSQGSQNNKSVWIKPPSGWSKLNIDGSAKRNLLAARGVIRSDQGEWTINFSKFIGIGIGKNELVEAWSLFIGLEIANFININKLEIEIDCQEIFNLINRDKNELHPLAILMSN